jgi:hypothetical protein
MQFAPSGNPVYAKRANHRPSLTPEQEWSVKEHDFVHDSLAESSSNNPPASFNQD